MKKEGSLVQKKKHIWKKKKTGLYRVLPSRPGYESTWWVDRV
jgi:hypothetical protein